MSVRNTVIFRIQNRHLWSEILKFSQILLTLLLRLLLWKISVPMYSVSGTILEQFGHSFISFWSCNWDTQIKHFYTWVSIRNIRSWKIKSRNVHFKPLKALNCYSLGDWINIAHLNPTKGLRACCAPELHWWPVVRSTWLPPKIIYWKSPWVFKKLG